ncbi:MAG: hypothetical protein HRT81_12720 [Henriciella sp.]|nr:hypothetical protein [Henriciella sp.]
MLPTEIQNLLDLVQQGIGGDATFKALLLLLENGSESDHIVRTLSQIEPANIADEDLRRNAINLLKRADAFEIATKWSATLDTADAASSDAAKIVNLHPGRAPVAEATRYGQIITFDDVGGLDKVKRQIHRKIIRPFENPGMVAKF